MDPFDLPTDFVLPSPADVDASVTKSEHLAKVFNALGDKLETTISQHYDAALAHVAQEFSDLPLRPDELLVTKRAGEHRAKKDAEQCRRDLLELHEPHIDEQVRQLHKLNEQLSGLLRVYPSPQAYLSSQHLGDAKRTEYLNQIERAGTAEVGTGDRALAAAVLSKLDSMPKDSRPYPAGDFAQRIVGEEHKRFAHAAQLVNNAFQNVINRRRELQKGQRNGHEHLKRGLRQNELDKLGPFVAKGPTPAKK